MLEIMAVNHVFQGPAGPVRVLEDVSFRLPAGEFAAVRGPSGCGKTTLLLTAGGLLRPTNGEILIDRVDPYRLSSEERSRLRREKIGFVFQQFHLIPYLSVLDNVLAPALARPRPDARDWGRELIARLNLTDRIDHLPAALSTGERQRTALARALLNRPKLVLADEPTGNLDDENSAAVLEYLASFAADGAAVLLVTHDAAMASQAHKQYRLTDGRLLAERL